MPDLTAANVTVTILYTARERGGGEKRIGFSVAYGDGALTYPAGGVPLPSGRSFGLPNNFRHVSLTDTDNAQAIIIKLDQVNKKVRHYFPTQQTGGAGNRAGVEYTGGATAVPATVLRGEAWGW